MPSPPDALEALEIKLSFLEQGLQQLSDVVHRQQQQIDALTAQSQRLLRQLESLAVAGDEPPATHEVPPHY